MGGYQGGRISQDGRMSKDIVIADLMHGKLSAQHVGDTVHG